MQAEQLLMFDVMTSSASMADYRPALGINIGRQAIYNDCQSHRNIKNLEVQWRMSYAQSTEREVGGVKEWSQASLLMKRLTHH